MKNKVIWALFVIGCAMFNGCSGDDSDVTPDPQAGGEFDHCRLIQSDRLNFSSHLFTYDDQGRVIKHESGANLYEVTYAADEIVVKKYSSGDLERTETVKVNSAGMAIHVEAVYENGVTPKRTTDFEYDGQGQLVKKTESNAGNPTQYHTVYQWHDGNLVAESEPDLSDMTKYTYNSEPSQPADWFHQLNLERGYATIKTKNRLTSTTVPHGVVYARSYKEDDKGLIKSVTVSPSDRDTYTETFTYDCE